MQFSTIKPRRRYPRLGLLLVVLGMGSLITGYEDRTPNPPPSYSRKPLALDCIIAGNQVYVPLEPLAAPDRPFLSVGSGTFVDVSMIARLPPALFCALDAAGYSQLDLGTATATMAIDGVTKPVPPQVVLPAAGLPITNINTASACGGSEMAIDFPPVTSVPWGTVPGRWTFG